ncbi:MAG: hypothetical protein DRJ31_03725 [Candidatus Methanomethylicota archaeon]|uniref:Receptor ligand binding region domain-containing protein n=1 Tax=Thermoproteota archaeon TaxID=2056631 RepID=A0A497EZP0_9CREN|nr:MAG: hypothetical protein DRJ31_03725 [Candidatus Verstraetearchaeota archaeon]RLE52657.1 MAG: hypothetical protein DRJ33_03175 [Candidatus Verstraetearchaeota archaeon]
MAATQKSTLFIVVALIIGLVIGAAAGYAAAPAKEVVKEVQVPVYSPLGTLPSEVKLGALLPLTGALSSYGENGKYALLMAQDDINEYVQEVLGLNLTFTFVIEDTQTSPDGALNAIKTLAAQGIKAVVGPYASGEASKVLSYAETNKIVVLSPSSTAPSLAIPDDMLFRTVPTDLAQGDAIAKILWNKGVRKAVIMYRNDDWGVGLNNVISEKFTELGGEVESIPYDPYAEEYSADVATLVDKVNAFGTGEDVGVVLVSFEDDGIDILTLAKEQDVLMSVKWFGTDGIAYSSKIASAVGDVCEQVGLVATIYSPAKSVKKEQFMEKYEAEYGMSPHPYSMNLYDSAWILALSVLEARTYDGEVIAKVLPKVADNYFGVSGWTKLNEAGDRAYGDYAITAVKLINGTYTWVDVGSYSAATGAVTWFAE